MPRPRFLSSLLLTLILLAPNTASAETIRFESGAKQPSPFQVRLAKNQGKPRPKGTPGVEISAALAKPNGEGPHPAIVILHSCGGMSRHVSHDWPQYLNMLGYAVLTVDSFGSRGLGPCPNGLKLGAMLEDAFGALDYLARQPFIDADRVGIFGYSKGGVAVNEIAGTEHRISDVKFLAGISFYGSCEPILGVEHQLHLPIAVIYGEHDAEMASCKKLISNPKLEVTVLRDAYHGFDAQERSGRKTALGTVMRYDAMATAKARAIVEAFLTAYF